MFIDTDELFAKADSLTVAEYIGMNVVRKGNNYYIPCPGHEKRLGKPDLRIGNCVLTPKGYHCFACGVTVSMVDMVMEFESCTFREAIETIAESCGGVEFFASSEKHNERKATLSPEDLALIGLCSGLAASVNSGKLFLNASDSKVFAKDNCAVLQKDNEYIVYEKVKGMTLPRLFAEDEKAYYDLISRKAKEAMERYQKAIELFGARNAPGAKKVFDLMNDNGSLSDADICGIKNILQKKLWRATEIYKEAQKSVR